MPSVDVLLVMNPEPPLSNTCVCVFVCVCVFSGGEFKQKEIFAVHQHLRLGICKCDVMEQAPSKLKRTEVKNNYVGDGRVVIILILKLPDFWSLKTKRQNKEE